MVYKRIIPGLVIELPRDQEHHGVILDATRMKNNWFKVSILLYNGDVATCRLKVKEDGNHLWYRNYHQYNTLSITGKLVSKDF